MSSKPVASIVMSRHLRRMPDLSRRAHLSELMDKPCSYQDLRACLKNLAEVNRTTIAYRPTLQWLEQFAQPPFTDRPLHIVDIGCGGGDMLRRIERWAVRRQIAVRLTGIDLNPHAVRAASEFTAAGSRIRWIVGDAYSVDSTTESIDLVISSLFTHHLEDHEILRYLNWMERVAQRGWFISDLRRSWSSYLGFKALAMAVDWHLFIRHDGPISIRRAFRPAEWRQYIEASGLSPKSIRIDARWPGRISVSRRKQQ